MCGIIGIINLDGKSDVDKDAFSRLTHSIKHSGPDDYGILHQKEFSFGHRRLSIIDLSKKGRQPMWDWEKKAVITFNGEIFNFQEIKEELIKRGHRFTNKTDTEVILEAYKEWGIDGIKRFNGEFAFGLYVKEKKEFYLVRDRFGIKPLFYSINNRKIFFCSEIKGIINYPGFERRLNYKAVSSYLSYRYVLGEETLLKEVYNLEPANYLKIKNGIIAKSRYWKLNPKEKKLIVTKRDKQKIKDIFYDAVKIRLISDVPVGMYLSGGIDSTLILSIASKLQPLTTYTVGFKEKGEYNEYKYATLAANYYHQKNVQFEISAADYLKTLKELIKYRDQPLALFTENSIYSLCKKIKEDGTTVVLTGEGSDELFGGYARQYRRPFDYQRLKFMRFLPRSFRRAWLSKIGLNESYLHLNPREFFIKNYTYFPLEDKKKIFNEKMNLINRNDEYCNKAIQGFFNEVSGKSYKEKLLYVFWKMHWPGILAYMDSTSRATAVEVRVPFADYRLVEHMFKIPYRHKLRWNSIKDWFKALPKSVPQLSEKQDTSKYLMKKIFFPELPKTIVKREKIAFPVPLEEWFVVKKIDWIKKLLLSKNSKSKLVFDQKN